MRRSTLIASLCVLTLVGTSCVRDKDPEPGLRAITTDLQYKELQEDSAAPPNTVPAERPETVQETPPSETLPPFEDAPPGPVPPATCPEAAPTEQADEDVNSTKVVGKPANGDYLWKVDGSEWYGAGNDEDDPDDDVRLGLSPFVKKQIQNTKVDDDEMTWEVVERELSATNPDTATVRSFFRAGPTGVAVERIERKTQRGQTSTFAPLEPVRYLVLPVKFGSQNAWSDQAIAVVGGEVQVLEQTAYVRGRITIDACGERVRAWHVVADQHYRKGAEEIVRHFEFGVATQLGGIVIYEDIRSPCTWDADKKKCTEDRVDLIIKSNIGQTKPS